MYLRLALNSYPYFLSLPSAWIIDVHHHTWFENAFFLCDFALFVHVLYASKYIA
jgi:hypothetical protein